MKASNAERFVLDWRIPFRAWPAAGGARELQNGDVAAAAVTGDVSNGDDPPLEWRW